MMTNMGVSSPVWIISTTRQYTPSRTKVDPTARFAWFSRMDDPGFHNWIDTEGFERGICQPQYVFGQPQEFARESSSAPS